MIAGELNRAALHRTVRLDSAPSKPRPQTSPPSTQVCVFKRRSLASHRLHDGAGPKAPLLPASFPSAVISKTKTCCHLLLQIAQNMDTSQLQVDSPLTGSCLAVRQAARPASGRSSTCWVFSVWNCLGASELRSGIRAAGPAWQATEKRISAACSLSLISPQGRED